MPPPDEYRPQSPQQFGSQHQPFGPPYPAGGPSGQPFYPHSAQAGAFQRTNGTAIAALVFALVFSPLGIVLGHIALGQIKRTGEGGAGLAKAALIVGYVLFVIPMIVVLVLMVLVAQDRRDRPSAPSVVTNTITETPHALAPQWRAAGVLHWSEGGPAIS